MHSFDASTLIFARATVMVTAAFAFSLAWQRSAAARSTAWDAVVVCLLALPVLSWVLPPGMLTIAAPAAVISIQKRIREPVLVAILFDRKISNVWRIVWAMGVIVFGVRLILAHLAARRLLNRARQLPVNGSVHRSFVSICREVNLGRRIRLCTSDAVTVPVASGALEPHVILPRNAVHWSTERLEAVMRHEIAHVARHDFVARLAFEIACVIYWPNPLVWYAAARARADQERAADDFVLRAGSSPDVYVDALLMIARASAEGARPIGLAATAPPLKARIAAILDGRERSPLDRARYAIAVTSVGLTTMLALLLATATLSPLSPGTAANRDGANTLALHTAPAVASATPIAQSSRKREVFNGAGDTLLHAVYYSDRPVERAAAARRLARGDRVKAAASLVALLSDSCYAYRWRAARGLRELAVASALAPLIDKMLVDEHPAVRSMAANAIAALPLSKSAPALRAALVHAPRSAFSRAGRALDTLGETPAHTALLTALRDARSVAAGSD